MRFAFPTRVALSSVPSENSRKFSEMRLTLSLASYSECVLYWRTTVEKKWPRMRPMIERSSGQWRMIVSQKWLVSFTWLVNCCLYRPSMAVVWGPTMTSRMRSKESDDHLDDGHFVSLLATISFRESTAKIINAHCCHFSTFVLLVHSSAATCLHSMNRILFLKSNLFLFNFFNLITSTFQWFHLFFNWIQSSCTPFDWSWSVLSNIFWVQLDPTARSVANPAESRDTKWRPVQCCQFSPICSQNFSPIDLDSKPSL